MNSKPFIGSIALFLSVVSILHAEESQNLLLNPGLEEGLKGWSAAVPGESRDDSLASISTENPHSGVNSVKLSIPQSIRYNITPSRLDDAYSQQPGDRFRIRAWVRAGSDFVQDPTTPGFYVRITMLNGLKADIPNGLLFFGLDGRASHKLSALDITTVPKTWTEITGVFEVPADAAAVYLNFFVNNGTGSIFIDDASIEKVPASTPLSPLEN